MAEPRIAMLGGTFDPVHIGHVRSAIELREVLGLDEVRMMVNRQPPHRQTPGVDAQDRFDMLAQALETVEGIVPDGRELTREGPSYSIDTVRSLRTQYGDQARLLTVIGTDALAYLDQWHDPQALFDYAHVVAITRPDASDTFPNAVRELLAGRAVSTPEALFSKPCGHFMSLSLPTLIPLSATAIRTRLREGRSVRYLVPEPVEALIASLGLYRR